MRINTPSSGGWRANTRKLTGSFKLSSLSSNGEENRLVSLGRYLTDRGGDGIGGITPLSVAFETVPDMDDLRQKAERAKELMRVRCGLYDSLSRIGLELKESPIPCRRP